MIDKYQELKLRDRIKYNKTIFQKGDKVFLIRKKSNGYPKNIEFNTEYIVRNVLGDHLAFVNSVGKVFCVNKTFFTKKLDLRDINLEKMLKNL